MAEAFGIAGSAFGTVSLGIQLFTEITKYLDSVEGRDEDLERAKNYAQDFHSSLIALKALASTIGISDTDLGRAINQGQYNCARTINNLSRMVAELKGEDPIPNSRTSKAKILCVKLKYPFKKQNLENLEKQLFNTVRVLDFALRILELKRIHIIQMSVQSMERALSNQPIPLLEPRNANCNNLLPGRDEIVAEMSSESTMCSTSESPVSRIRSTRYQNGTVWTMNSFCVCRKNFKRRERRQWGPFIVENEVSLTDYHSPGCPLSTEGPLEQQTKRTLKFPIPFTGSHWKTASQFSLFFTAGTGGMGFGQSLVWVETVDRYQSPSFKILQVVVDHQCRLNNEDNKALLLSCYRRLKWCFANRRASISDVDEFGRSIVAYYTTYNLFVLPSGEHCFPNEALQVFCMLAPFINPVTYPDSGTSSPLLAQLCQNIVNPNSSISGEAISSLLSRCDDSAGQDCQSPFPYNSPQEQFDLVKDFPEISNYLEYGQLSRLILLEEQDKIRYHLVRYPSSINEINHLGQTPVHIAVQTQNATILSMLVNHADRKILNTQDNNGHYAIDHAADALCHTLKSRKEGGSTVCNGCEVLNILLRSESAIFTDSVRRSTKVPREHGIPTCTQGQKNIIRSLAARRKELRTLAQRELTPVERQNLKFCEAGILDQSAAETQRLLEAKKCHVPIRLKVYDNDESPKDSESIYLLISHGDVAEFALQSGFLMPMTLFDDMFRSLAISLNSGNIGYGQQDFLFSSYICWLVDHGGDLHSPVPTLGGRRTAAHYFMAYLGTCVFSFGLVFRVPLSSKVSSIIFEEDSVDDCQCPCSPKGCTPLTKFLAVTNWQQHWLLDLGISKAIGDVLQYFEDLCGLLGHVGYDLTKEHWIDCAAVRHFTFFILGLRHTCCFLGDDNDNEDSGPLSTLDRLEIEEEDSSRLELLEQLVTEFERERGNYADLLSFAREYWAPRMEVVQREIESYVLTETQRQSAEAAGVVWKSYGPQLPCDDILTVDIENEEEVSELERVLRKLDKIATDPARPSVI